MRLPRRYILVGERTQHCVLIALLAEHVTEHLVVLHNLGVQGRLILVDVKIGGIWPAKLKFARRLLQTLPILRIQPRRPEDALLLLDSRQQLLAVLLHDHEHIAVDVQLDVAEVPQVIVLLQHGLVLLLPIRLLLVQPTLVIIYRLSQLNLRLFVLLLQEIYALQHVLLLSQELLAEAAGRVRHSPQQ